MFRKVLIANRGAIACRIIRTLRPHGDRDASRSIPRPIATRCMSRRRTKRSAIGPSPAAESYLKFDAILDARRRPAPSHPSGLRFSVRKIAGFRGRVRSGRHRVHRTDARAMRASG